MTFTASIYSKKGTEKWIPKEGDIVTFNHYGFIRPSMKPRFPSLSTMQPILTWDTVVNRWNELTNGL